MKILCVIDSLGSGGAQRQLVSLAIGFKEKGHEVSVLVYHDEDFFLADLSKLDIPVSIINENNYFLRIIKIRSFIRGGKYDGVLSFLEGVNFIVEISSFPFRKWKLIVGERSSNPNILTSFKLRAYRWFHFFADTVVANSHENVRIVRECNPWLGQDKLKVIYNQVDLKKWHYINTTKERKDDQFRLIVIANHQPLKNALGLIKAVNLLPDNIKNKLSVHWYGRQDTYEVKEAFLEAKNLLNEYKLESCVRFFLPNSDIHKIVQNFDALGLFSLYEGLPNTICEGMASGKPIVASAVSDIPIFIEEGVNGYLCDPHDLQSIANALAKVIETPKEMLNEMGIRNRKKAEIMFSEKETVTSYLNLFEK